MQTSFRIVPTIQFSGLSPLQRLVGRRLVRFRLNRLSSSFGSVSFFRLTRLTRLSSSFVSRSFFRLTRLTRLSCPFGFVSFFQLTRLLRSHRSFGYGNFFRLPRFLLFSLRGYHSVINKLLSGRKRPDNRLNCVVIDKSINHAKEARSPRGF